MVKKQRPKSVCQGKKSVPSSKRLISILKSQRYDLHQHGDESQWFSAVRCSRYRRETMFYQASDFALLRREEVRTGFILPQPVKRVEHQAYIDMDRELAHQDFCLSRFMQGDGGGIRYSGALCARLRSSGQSLVSHEGRQTPTISSACGSITPNRLQIFGFFLGHI